MKHWQIIALGALALSACTGTPLKKLPVCDGKSRRPANIYGSVLPSLPVPMLPREQGVDAAAVPLLDAQPAPAASSPGRIKPLAEPHKPSPEEPDDAIAN